ncbi:hypothetical protein NQ117_03985 [Paenibacillus sp. SC116]|uniref:hypothetical protein n=1 Tax=Paenibacillus sp. SC116 TaxID=2968986 RepID=UPI00215AA8CC|nr:hypothetical protein [Paenibacillus sp. SC116]MCR8842833.1 hypothetical protein [Paenibacillus sp. SC116]
MNMSKVLKALAILALVGGIFLGVNAANAVDELARSMRARDKSYVWSVALSWWIGGVVSGILFYALAMMLDHLESIKRSLNTMNNDPSPSAKKSLASLNRYKS